MRVLFLFSMLFLVFIILGCTQEEVSSEPIITGDVTDQEPEVIEKHVEEQEKVLTVKLCHDTDNGIIRWDAGQTFGFYNNATRFEFSDYCLDEGYLMEYYCDEEDPNNRLFACRNGCVDSHCA